MSMSLVYKSIDTMKISRDNGTTSKAKKTLHLNSLNTIFPNATHFALGCYMHNYTYQPQAYVQEWADAVHATGKSIWWRPVPNIDNSISSTQATTNIVADITANPTWFVDGDIFEMQPETSPNGFTDGWTGDAASITAWNSWIRSTISAMQTAFTNMGKNVDCTFVSLVSYYVRSGLLETATITSMNNHVCMDEYPLDIHDPIRGVYNLVDLEIGDAHSHYPDADIILSETGCGTNLELDDSTQRENLRLAYNALSNLNYVIGMNYWVGYGYDYNKSNLYQRYSLTNTRPAAITTSEFFSTGKCTKRMTVI